MSAAASENAFMASLFADLDASIFSEGPSQATSKSSPSQSPAQLKRRSSQRPSCALASPVSPPVRLSQSPLLRKKAAKRAKCDPGCSSGSSATRGARAEDIRAATESLLHDAGDWIDDVCSPSPQHLMSPSQGSQEQKVGAKQARYTRCIVKDVVEDHFIPPRFLAAPQDRYTTKGVKPSTVTAAMQRRQKVLYLHELEMIEKAHERRREEQREGQRRKLILRDEWYSTPVRPGDVVHLIGKWGEESDEQVHRFKADAGDDDSDEALWKEMDGIATPPPSMVPTMTLASTAQSVDTSGAGMDNLLVLHPDVLLSATAVSTVIRCTRKSYLQSTIKSSGPASEDAPSESLLMGRMLHEVLQSCLTGRRKELRLHDDDGLHGGTSARDIGAFPAVWNGPDSSNFSLGFVRDQIEAQVQSSLEDILSAGLDTGKAVDKLWEAAAPFGLFASRYLLGDKSGGPQKEAAAVDARSTVAPLVRVQRILDVEEDIWSPTYGLKGFVDVSVEVQVREGDKTRTLVMPLELKTGRSVDMVQHKAQTMLYTLMMTDRYQRTVDAGLLYYSKTGTLHLVRSVRNEVRGLMMARNELAGYMVRRSGTGQARPALPPTIDSKHDCSRCYVTDECMLYKRAVEGGLTDAASSPIADLYDAKVMHLTAQHLRFFQHWEHLLTLEEDDVVRFRRELWTMTAAAREATGRCLADMVLVEQKLSEQSSGSRELSRSLNGMNDRVVVSFGKANHSSIGMGGSLAEGDPISVSVQPDQFSVAQGHILRLTERFVTVAVDRDVQTLAKRWKNKKPVSFRIDKEEFANGMARVRYNLAKLFYAGVRGDTRRRELVVDLRAPRFLGSEVAPRVRCSQDGNGDMNEDQRKAVDKVLAAEDYALIVGMPGTGKTTTIVQLIKELISRGASILLASYTHSAVDTICRKLLVEPSVNLLRIGNMDRVHSDIHSRTLQGASSVEELHGQLMLPNVVATTCLSISHALFAKRTFDYCIVDEASQITLPTCLGPLRYADKFVLVGDSMQLPPLVKNQSARLGGLDISLFDRLQSAHPQSLVQLRVQYRMNADIMALSNHLIYDGLLRCGSDAIRDGSLQLPALKAALQRAHSIGGPISAETCTMDRCWIEQALDSATRALFIDTDLVSCAREKRVAETLLENEGEAEIVTQLSAAFVSAGVPMDEIAIITPYRQQIRAIVRGLRSAAAADKIEVLTADKSQGRDKDVVLISLVRSRPGQKSDDDNADSGIGQLLNDVKRINVALTRARKKLIIVGSKSTLSRSDLLKRLWDLMDSHAWTMHLSDEQLRQHQQALEAVWQGVPAKTTERAVKGKLTQAALVHGRPVLQDILNEVR